MTTTAARRQASDSSPPAPDADVGRRLGIPAIAQAPWGTHFCQFYRTKQDLLDILVPYFKHGLEDNEFCMWVTSEPLDTSEAITAMRQAVPDLEDAIRRGQIEFWSYQDWYVPGGVFDGDRVLSAWVDKLAAAQRKGFQGLRLTGNTFWLERTRWADFTDYERAVNQVIGRYRMIALCTYSLDGCTASEIVDVVMHHQFALIKRDTGWTLIEPSERKRATEAVEQMNQALNTRTAELQDALARLQAALDTLAAQADERERLAREVNDTIVQGLVAAEASYDLGEAAHARDLLRATSRQAREWVGMLLGVRGLQPGVARRDAAAWHPTGDGGP
jgi:hypothetical protein